MTTQNSLSPCPLLRDTLVQRAATLATVFLAGGAGHALADDLYAVNAEPTKLPQIEVTSEKEKALSSPKYTQPLVDTPQTIAVIPSAVYSEQGATSLRDVLRNTPGITFQAGEGGGAPGDNLYIRGFGARNDVYIDGVRDPGVLTRDTFNVEQVEVAKGPSSAVSGRGSTGGSVNLVTKTPALRAFTDVQATYGSADYGRVTLDVNRPLGAAPVPGTALRLNGVWTDGGVPGRDAVKNTNWGIAPSLAFGLGTPTTVTVAYLHFSQDNIPDYGLPGTLPALASAAGQTQYDLDWSNFYGLLARDYEKIETDVATVSAEHKFGQTAVLRNVTRYGRNDRDAVVTPPRAASASNGAADPGYDASVPQIRRTDTKYQDRTDVILANQTSLTLQLGHGAVRHSLALGAEFSREDQRSRAKTDTYANGRPPVTDLYDPNPSDPYTPSIVFTGARTKGVADSGALYAFDTVELGSRFEVTGGARWEVVDTHYTSTSTTGVDTRYSRDDDMLSWRTAVVYKPRPNGSIYAGYATSFNPSIDGNQGLTLGGSGNNSQDLDPEKNRSTELGTKWDVLRQRLSLAAALFRTEKTNARTTDVNGDTVLAGDQRVDGFELSATGSLTDDWSVFAGYAGMDGSVRTSGVAAQEGASLQYVPKVSFNAWTTYRLPFGLTIGGGVQHVDGYFYALPSATSTPGEGLGTDYTLYQLMAAYAVNKQLSLRLNVNNVADERYIDRGYNGHFIPGPGRNVQLTASLHF